MPSFVIDVTFFFSASRDADGERQLDLPGIAARAFGTVSPVQRHLAAGRTCPPFDDDT